MQKIVVGIDGSSQSREALQWAVEEAGARGAAVAALHAYVVEPPAPDASPAPPFDLPALVTELHEGAVAFVVQVVQQVVGDTPVDVAPMAVEDAPAKALLDASRDADLLVVGSHGVGASSLRLGSVSLECAQHASCPVVIHRRSA
jgi:nucleotide-binding universal stress UspA family protein